MARFLGVGVNVIKIDESKLGLLKSENDEETGSLIESGITQKILRTFTHGIDRITGLFRCDFEAGQSRYVLNIPIHPPLDKLPEVEAVAIEGNVRTRVTDRKKMGVRLEIITNEPNADGASVYVEVVISAASNRDAKTDEDN